MDLGNVWSDFSDIFGTCPVYFLDMFRACLGHVLDMFGTCFGHVRDMFWTSFGHVLDICLLTVGQVVYKIWAIFQTAFCCHSVAQLIPSTVSVVG